MGYKFLELEEVKESGRWTESGVEAPKAYKGHKRCAHCENEFIVNQLKRGREPIYCSNRCKVAAYVKRKGIKNQHPLAEMQGLKGGIDERYLAQIDELKAQVEGFKEAQKTQAEELKKAQKAQKVANDIILKKIAALAKGTKETSCLQTKKTAKGVATDIATSALGVLIAKEVGVFFTKWENKPATKGDLELLEEKVHHWFRQVRGGIIRDVTHAIKEEQKKGIFY